MKLKSYGERETILHIAPTPFFSDRGCHIRIAGVVRCLERQGYANEVCTYHTGKDVDDISTYRIGNIKGYTKTSAGPSPYKLWADLKLLYIVLRHYRLSKPLAIHAHLHEGVLIGLIVKILYFWRKTPLIADMQGSLAGELETYGVFKKYGFLRWPVKTIERILLKLSNKIVCSSQHSVELFCEIFPESADKITLAQDGADEPTPCSTAKLDTLRSTVGIDPEAVCIVYSGALLDSKGLQELKTLIFHARNAEQQLHFLIIGFPTEDLERYLEKHDLLSLCTLTGQLDFSALSEHLALATLAIDPKNSDAGEGSGKILNYMANSLAIVAFDTINNRKFLGSDTRLAKNIDDAYDILILYAHDKKFARQEGEKNRERFIANYSWNVCERQLQSVYGSLPNLS